MTGLASCSTASITRPAVTFRLLPAGVFRAIDGRPEGIAGWQLDGDLAAFLVQQAAGRAADFVIDYEHQTLRAAATGRPAPAAGWFKRLEWREGDGLYVMDARWTDMAACMIGAREYRYLSPVFRFDGAGRVVGIHSAALTNTPAIDGLTELAAAKQQAEYETRLLNYEMQRAARIFRHSLGEEAGELAASLLLSGRMADEH